MEKSRGAKHVVISGGSRGLGLAMVQTLLAGGYAISTFARNHTPAMDEAAEQWPERFSFHLADITSSDGMQEFCRNAIGKHGEIYGVINNSGVAVDGILATLPEVEVMRMLAINLEGAIRLTRLALRSMMKTGAGGRVLNISSIIGSRGYTGLSVYSATKAGLDGFTRSLARELGRMKITVNGIAPGYVRTDMTSKLGEDELAQIIRRTPLGRLAEADDISPLVSFLLSDGARLITGQVILVDGGISC